jgi:hypothetical protein
MAILDISLKNDNALSAADRIILIKPKENYI